MCKILAPEIRLCNYFDKSRVCTKLLQSSGHKKVTSLLGVKIIGKSKTILDWLTFLILLGCTWEKVEGSVVHWSEDVSMEKPTKSIERFHRTVEHYLSASFSSMPTCPTFVFYSVQPTVFPPLFLLEVKRQRCTSECCLIRFPCCVMDHNQLRRVINDDY